MLNKNLLNRIPEPSLNFLRCVKWLIVFLGLLNFANFMIAFFRQVPPYFGISSALSIQFQMFTAVIISAYIDLKRRRSIHFKVNIVYRFIASLALLYIAMQLSGLSRTVGKIDWHILMYEVGNSIFFILCVIYFELLTRRFLKESIDAGFKKRRDRIGEETKAFES